MKLGTNMKLSGEAGIDGPAPGRFDEIEIVFCLFGKMWYNGLDWRG